MIYFQVLAVDFCCGDVISIHDGDGPNSGVLLTIDQSTLSTDTVISSGNKLYIHMSLQKHWGCTGALMKYYQGELKSVPVLLNTVYRRVLSIF